ncbi:MAG: phenylacetate--CoA ligase family protein [Dehalogenimonas sp.]
MITFPINIPALFQNIGIHRSYRDVLTIKNREDLVRFQRKHLESLLLHAYQKVPYYTRVFDGIGLISDGKVDFDNFNKIPILTKELMKKHRTDLLSTDHKSRHSFTSSTGGSTGEPTLFTQDREYVRWGRVANRYYYDKILGINEGTLRKIILWGSHDEYLHTQKDVISRLLYSLNNTILLNSFKMTDADLIGYLSIINKYKPDLIRGYASSLFHLCQFIDNNELQTHHPRIVISSAETLTDEMRNTVERVLGAKVFNFYGSRETNNLGGECPQGLIHTLGFHEYVEIINADGSNAVEGEEGRVVVTNLHNYAMPFIRCDLGDLAVRGPDICSCGSPLPTLRSVTGRSNQILRGCNGIPISPCFVPYLFYPGCDDSNEGKAQYQKIKQYQLIQESKDHISVKIIVDPNSGKSDFEYIISNIKQVLGQEMNVQLNLVDDIEPLPSGKKLYVLSKVEPNISPNRL